MRILRSGLLFLSALALTLPASAQGAPPDDGSAPGLRFNGLGRTYIQQTDLGGRIADTDTTTAQALADGEFVLDLAVNAQPNRSTEVQGTLRLRNEFGGFFGSGVTVAVRELWARGIIANAVEWRLGDMDLGLTEYTVHLPEADGVVNAPELFEAQQERVYYEEFYTGQNERRFQGGRVDFGLAFDQAVESVDVRSFIARLRPTDFQTTPTRLIGGGRIGATSAAVGPFENRITLGANLASTWDDLDSGNANTGIRNHVLTFDGDLHLYSLGETDFSLTGEAGRSVAATAERRDSTRTTTQLVDGQPVSTTEIIEVDVRTFDESDTFFEIGLEAEVEAHGLTVATRFVDVGPDFFSVAAQSKRIDYARALSTYNRIGNARDRRTLGLFDLTRDAGIYTFRVADRLMTYDPRYNNALPYGRATPNRRGVRLEADYMPDEAAVTGGLLVAFLNEIRGQGTELLKSFTLVRAHADVAVAPWIGYSRDLGVTLGAQYESTNRGGDEIETVDLTSVLFEAGIAAEVYDRLDVLFGAKLRMSDGRDYVPQYENFNDIRDFPGPFVTDDSETLVGTGLRYRFRDDVYLTVQYQRYAYGDDATPEDDYALGQVFALYSMTF